MSYPAYRSKWTKQDKLICAAFVCAFIIIASSMSYCINYYGYKLPAIESNTEYLSTYGQYVQKKVENGIRYRLTRPDSLAITKLRLIDLKHCKQVAASLTEAIVQQERIVHSSPGYEEKFPLTFDNGEAIYVQSKSNCREYIASAVDEMEKLGFSREYANNLYLNDLEQSLKPMFFTLLKERCLESFHADLGSQLRDLTHRQLKLNAKKCVQHNQVFHQFKPALFLSYGDQATDKPLQTEITKFNDTVIEYLKYKPTSLHLQNLNDALDKAFEYAIYDWLDINMTPFADHIAEKVFPYPGAPRPQRESELKAKCLSKQVYQSAIEMHDNPSEHYHQLTVGGMTRVVDFTTYQMFEDRLIKSVPKWFGMSRRHLARAFERLSLKRTLVHVERNY